MQGLHKSGAYVIRTEMNNAMWTPTCLNSHLWAPKLEFRHKKIPCSPSGLPFKQRHSQQNASLACCLFTVPHSIQLGFFWLVLDWQQLQNVNAFRCCAPNCYPKSGSQNKNFLVVPVRDLNIKAIIVEHQVFWTFACNSTKFFPSVLGPPLCVNRSTQKTSCTCWNPHLGAPICSLIFIILNHAEQTCLEPQTVVLLKTWSRVPQSCSSHWMAGTLGK